MRRPGRGDIVLLCTCLALCAAGSAWGEPGYESGATLEARDLLPPDLLRGPHHAVEDAVRTDGFVHIYTVSSEFGRQEVRGEDALRERVREIEALAALQEASRSEAFAAAAARAGERPARDAVGIAGLPIGATPPKPAAGGGREVLDLDALQRRIAAELGIDPYTPNEALRAELARHAWVAAAGGMTSMQLPAAEPVAAEAPGNGRVGELLRNWSADDLEALNRIELAAMGVPEPLREAFLENPAYSPSTGTVLVEALSAMEGTDDREAFIAAAAGASSADDALAFQRMAELIRSYGERSGGVQKITTVDGRVAAFSADGTLVVPVLADHAVWTERVASFTESMARAAGEDPNVARTRFLVSGSVSNRARSEIQERGIEVTEEGGEPAGP
jgi:hypothetical protein